MNSGLNAEQARDLQNLVKGIAKTLGGKGLGPRQALDVAIRAIETVAQANVEAGSGEGRHQRFNQLMIEAADAEASKRRVPCRAGCSHCCKSERIEIFAYEAKTIQRNFDTIEEPVKRKILENLHSYQRTNVPAEKNRSPCVFLVNEKCSIHKFRPAACWSYLSKSESLCSARLKNSGGPSAPLEYPVALYYAFHRLFQLSGPEEEGTYKEVDTHEMNTTMKHLLLSCGTMDDLPPSTPPKDKSIPIVVKPN